jgi:hypothetical protein
MPTALRPRTLHSLLAFILLPVGYFGFGLLALYYSNWFAIVALGWAVGLGMYSGAIKNLERFERWKY